MREREKQLIWRLEKPGHVSVCASPNIGSGVRPSSSCQESEHVPQLSFKRQAPEASTVEEQVEQLLCVYLGYSIQSRRTNRRYPTLVAFLEAEESARWTLWPPDPQDLRVHLAALSLESFERTVIACAYAAPSPPGFPAFDRPGQEFLGWLVRSIRENTALERGRPRCLFYCLGFRLGLLLPTLQSPNPAAGSDLPPVLRRVWENFVTGLLQRLLLWDRPPW